MAAKITTGWSTLSFIFKTTSIDYGLTTTDSTLATALIKTSMVSESALGVILQTPNLRVPVVTGNLLAASLYTTPLSVHLHYRVYARV